MESTAHELLLDVFGRTRDQFSELLTGLEPQDLRWRPGPRANPIGWIAWHLTRIQDDHLAGLASATGTPTEQAWFTGGWQQRFGLPYDPTDHGYGHSPEQVAAFDATADDLLGYHVDVAELTLRVVEGLSDFSRVVDESWDPPVTASVRLVSVVDEVNQHLGQVAYVRGLLEAR